MKKEKDRKSRILLAINIVLALAILIVLVMLIKVKVAPIIHPSGHSLIREGLSPYAKANSMRGSIHITNNVTVDLSSTLGKGVRSDLAVATTGSAFVIDNHKMYVDGSTNVKYSDIAETTNYFKVYKDMNKKKQYVYYTDKQPGQEYMKDYENWAAIDVSKSNIDNFPSALGSCLDSMKDISLKTMSGNRGYTVTGEMDKKALAVLIRYMVQVDTKNTCLMNGIELDKDSTQKITADFDSNRNIKDVNIDITKAKAGSFIKINTLHIDFTVEQNKQTLTIPKMLTEAVLDTDFDIPVYEDDIKNDIGMQGQDGKMPDNDYRVSLDSLGLKFVDKKITDLDKAKDVVLNDNNMDGMTGDDSKNSSYSAMKSDNNARVYFYTDQSTGDITQIEFDNSYAKNSKLPVKMAGLSVGDTTDTVTQILGDPDSKTSGNGIDTYSYRIGKDSDYLLTLTFYQGDALVNSGLQRINIKKNENADTKTGADNGTAGTDKKAGAEDEK